MADPSPLPWTFEEEIFGGDLLLLSAGRGIATVDSTADAALICASVNAHAALVEALRKIATVGYQSTVDDLLHARALLKELDTK